MAEKGYYMWQKLPQAVLQFRCSSELYMLSGIREAEEWGHIVLGQRSPHATQHSAVTRFLVSTLTLIWICRVKLLMTTARNAIQQSHAQPSISDYL